MMPNEHGSHDEEIHLTAGMIAFGTAMSGLLLACCIYWWRLIDPAEVRSMFAPIYRFLLNKWWFDELYDKIFIKPTLWFGRCVAGFDRRCIDWLIDNLAIATRWFTSGFDRWIDQTFVDGLANWIARKTYGSWPLAAEGADRPPAAIPCIYPRWYGGNVFACDHWTDEITHLCHKNKSETEFPWTIHLSGL